jgi:hypothetical protein
MTVRVLVAADQALVRSSFWIIVDTARAGQERDVARRFAG